MKCKILLVLGLCTFVVASAFAEDDVTITVNCAAGQSLNGTLSRLPKLVPATVVVHGTCTEYISINGFHRLTLKGAPGAALQQPATTPSNGLGVWVLSIGATPNQ